MVKTPCVHCQGSRFESKNPAKVSCTDKKKNLALKTNQVMEKFWD